MRKEKIKYHIKEYFYFNRKERVGIVVLLVLMFLLLIFRHAWPLLPNPPAMDVSKFNVQIQNAGRLLDTFTAKKNNKPLYNKAKYITTQSSATTTKHPAPEILELNLADSVHLEQLPGIGSALAHRILRYRQLLGGFYRREQLSEVYGFKQEWMLKCLPFVCVDSTRVVKIQINTADFKTINAHPYISYEQTKLICNQRRKHLFVSLNQLVELQIFTNQEMSMIRPYVSLD